MPRIDLCSGPCRRIAAEQRGESLGGEAVPFGVVQTVVEDDPIDVQEHHHAGLWPLRHGSSYRAPHACRQACM